MPGVRRRWRRAGTCALPRLMPTSESSLAELLARHVPTEGKEREDLERMRAFVTELSHPFSRAQPRAHFTGSAVVVDPVGARVVLLHHGKLKRWLQPGGHSDEADAGSMEATALREAREETGCQVRLHPAAPRPLDVDIHSIPARKDEPEHLHLDVRFLLIAEDPEALRHDPAESFGAQWLTWEEALERADEPPLRRLLEKARAACR
jgi:8-oxo-dGTP pyrophosphatase MutT (NUDIX family)